MQLTACKRVMSLICLKAYVVAALGLAEGVVLCVRNDGQIEYEIAHPTIPCDDSIDLRVIREVASVAFFSFTEQVFFSTPNTEVNASNAPCKDLPVQMWTQTPTFNLSRSRLPVLSNSFSLVATIMPSPLTSGDATHLLTNSKLTSPPLILASLRSVVLLI